MSKHTPGPWEMSEHQKMRKMHSPKHWEYVKHEFPDYPYEGDLEREFGIYPPLGESGPVALVAGEANARLMTAAPDMLELLRRVENGSAKIMNGQAACLWCQEWPHEENCPVGRVIAKAEGDSNGN